MRYIIKFYSDYIDVDGDEYRSGEIIEASQKEMFAWVEKSKNENIKLMVYETICVLDLS